MVSSNEQFRGYDTDKVGEALANKGFNGTRITICEDMFDCWYLLSALDAATSEVLFTRVNSQQVMAGARRGISDIHNYFTESGITTKALFIDTPIDEDYYRHESKERLKKVNTKYRGFQDRVGKKIPDVSYVFSAIEDAVNAKHDQSIGKNIPIVIAAPHVRQHRNYPELIKQYTDLVHYLVIQPGSGGGFIRPHHIIGSLQDMSRTPVPGFADPFTKEYGGVSLKTLVDMEVDNEFKVHLFRYLRSLPKGDYFWQRIMEHVFFPRPAYREVFDEKFFQEFPQFALNCANFQLEVFHGVLAPVLDPSKIDKRFDKSFGQILSVCDSRLLYSLMRILHFNASELPTLYYLATRDYKNVTEVLREQTIYGLLVPDRLLMVSPAVDQMFVERQEEIRKSLQTRFPSVGVLLRAVFDGYDTLVNDIPEIADIYTTNYQKALESHMGETFRSLEKDKRRHVMIEELSLQPIHVLPDSFSITVSDDMELSNVGITRIDMPRGADLKMQYVEVYSNFGVTIMRLNEEGIVVQTAFSEKPPFKPFVDFIKSIAEHTYRYTSTMRQQAAAVALPSEEKVPEEATEEPLSPRKLSVEEAHDLLESLLLPDADEV